MGITRRDAIKATVAMSLFPFTEPLVQNFSTGSSAIITASWGPGSDILADLEALSRYAEQNIGKPVYLKDYLIPDEHKAKIVL